MGMKGRLFHGALRPWQGGKGSPHAHLPGTHEPQHLPMENERVTFPLSTGATGLMVNNLSKRNFQTRTVSLESLQDRNSPSSP